MTTVATPAIVKKTINFLDLFCGTYDGQNLSGRYTVKDLPRVFCVKNYNGYPIDTLYVDADPLTGIITVFDNYTEGDPPFGWKDPNAFKYHTGNINRGNRMMWLTFEYPFLQPLTITDATTPFSIFSPADKASNGVKPWDGKVGSILTSQIHTVGIQKRVLNMPTIQDWSGDVGSIQTFNYQYYYNGKVNVPFKSLEEYKLAYDLDNPKRRFGLVKWYLYKADPKGSYKTPEGTWTKVTESDTNNKLGGFKGKTPDGQHDQNARLVVFPMLGINGII